MCFSRERLSRIGACLGPISIEMTNVFGEDTETIKTVSPSAFAICLHLLVNCGSPAGMKV